MNSPGVKAAEMKLSAPTDEPVGGIAPTMTHDAKDRSCCPASLGLSIGDHRRTPGNHASGRLSAAPFADPLSAR